MRPHCLKLIAVCTLLGVLLASPCSAETPEEVLLRLERGRSNDAVEEKRRQETLEWQRRRKEQEYSARWKRYGDFDVDVTQWRRLENSVWITVAKYGLSARKTGGFSWPTDENDPKTPPNHRIDPPVPLEQAPVLRWGKKDLVIRTSGAITNTPGRFSQSLDELVRQGVVTPKERCLVSQNSSSCKTTEMSNWIGVSCGSLHFNKKIAGKPWGSWERPIRGSDEERLVIDRCASLTDKKQGVTDIAP
jgi:hypothetical protein